MIKNIGSDSHTEVKGYENVVIYLLTLVSFQTHMMFFRQWSAKGDVLKNVCAAHFHTVKAYKIKLQKMQ